MTGRSRDATLAAALLALLVLVGLGRPLLPIDETRYVAVAWEMWSGGDFLVPHLNGEPYSHKPPLLFWLIHAGWALFGVGETWPRLVSPLFAAGTMALAAGLARGLWPHRPEVARMAPLVLISSALFTYFAAALMFDVLLAFFVALGLAGLVRAWRGGGAAAGFAWFTLGLGGAMYAKGPVALVHLLPAALLAPWWMREQRPRWGRWYAGTGLALLGGAVLILAWAVPAGLAGGAAYRDAIFWGQSAGRMVESFAHRAPWWFYLVALPLMLVPWLLWPRWWAGLWRERREFGSDSGLRLAVLGLLLPLLFFSLVSGKRWHYLLPEFTLFALLVARSLAGAATRRGSLLVPALTLGAIGVVAIAAAPRVVARLGGLEEARALAWGGALALGCGGGLALLRPADPPRDVRRVASFAVVALAGLLGALLVALREPYDLQAVAGRIAQFEREGRPLAINGKYHGQWTLAARLHRPLAELPSERVAAWLAGHPRGRVLFVYRDPAQIPPGLLVESAGRYRGAWLAILAASSPADGD